MIRSLNFKGWKALSLTTAQAEVIVPVDIGPRVMSCGLRGGPNLFCVVEAEAGKRGEKDWHIRGGHRLWHAPEHPVRTYETDNAPVEVTKLKSGKGFTVKPAVEPRTGIQKSLTIEEAGKSGFKVTHVLENTGLWEIELSPWAVTVMAHDSYTTIPFNKKVPHGEALLPDYVLVPWTYTDFTDKIWQFRREYLGIDATQAFAKQKLGITHFPGWVANWQPGGTFVKYWELTPGAVYPDFGSVFETFACDFMTELESLGPLVKLAPGQSVTHVEHWGLFADLPKPDNDKAFAKQFRPAIEKWIKTLKK
jgi:hypothetical protein